MANIQKEKKKHKDAYFWHAKQGSASGMQLSHHTSYVSLELGKTKKKK